MYVDPFIAGVIVTLLVEIAFIIIFIMTHMVKVVHVEDEGEENNELHSENKHN